MIERLSIKMERKAEIQEQKKKIILWSNKLKMRIAICDSDKNYLKNLKQLLYRYSNTYKMDFIVEEFLSGEQLLQSENEYCIIFTEYILSGINGLETAKLLRRNNDKTAIVFLSQNTDFVFESFKVSPYRFLTKPLNCEDLFDTLNDFFKSYSEKYPLCITDDINTHCLNATDILYLEANNKHCFIHLMNEVITCKRTMARVFSALPQKHFKKIHRAFIVNLNFIEKYNNEYVFLSNGEKLHISRNYCKYFKEEYLNFANPKIP